MTMVTVPVRKLVLLIGTVKGVFLYHTDEQRASWNLTGPHLGGWEIFSLCGDSRNGRIIAGTGSFAHGPTVRTSRDFCATWHPVERNPAYPATAHYSLKHIWQIIPGHSSQPGTWYAGVDDAGLFVSRDD